MRRIAIAAALLIPTLAPVIEARADTVSGTRSPELFERKHAIALRFERTHATLVVQRTFENLGKEHDQAEVHILDLPLGAIAIGLRTQAIKNGQPIWYAGDLLEAELAAKRYHELTGIGGYFPKDPALLSWRSEHELALQVFPIDPKSKKTVEYTLAVPVRYEEGRYVLRIPAMGTPKLPATATVSASPGDVLTNAGAPVSNGASFVLGDELELELTPKNPPMFDATMASVSFGSEKQPRALVHTSIALPAKLSEAPKGAYVVIVLDASRSLDDDERIAEVAAADGYLRLLPDAHVEVLTFDRAVHARHGKFVDQPTARADLAKKPVVPANGSALELALAQAKSTLATAPAGVPKRVIVLTDLVTRNALQPSSVKGLESAQAVVHFGVIANGYPLLARDDDDRWAPIVRATGGLVWSAQASADPKHAAAMRDIYEEWVRPRKLDHVALTGIGVTDGLGIPDTMSEGTGFEDLRLTTYPTPAIEVHAELWAAKVKTLITPTKEQDKLWSALVFGDDLRDDLTEPEMMVLAMKGGAVSPVTSYLAIEPGVRPSLIGLDWGESIGIGGLGMIGIGDGGGGFGTGIGLGGANTPLQWLRAALTTAATTCGAGGRPVSASVETTDVEVVDVSAVGLGGAKTAADEALRSCIAEAVWSFALPSFFTVGHTTYAVKTTPK